MSPQNKTAAEFNNGILPRQIFIVSDTYALPFSSDPIAFDDKGVEIGSNHMGFSLPIPGVTQEIFIKAAQEACRTGVLEA